MKKIHIHLVCAVLSFSCVVLTPLATPTPFPPSINSPTDIPSSTPITPTLTFTSTPTLVGQKTGTPSAGSSPTPLIATPILLVTPNTPTLNPQMKGFLAVNISEKEFYKSNECQPTSVKFTAQVSDIIATAQVNLFVRFKSKQSDAASEWTRITMDTIGAGTYLHDLIPQEMKGGATFQNPWVQYQLVATNSKGREIGRTDIFSERLTLSDCKPTPTPEISATPTVLIP